MIDNSVLQDEAEIVWEVDVSDYEYVRQTCVPHSRRRGPVKAPAGRRLGYSTLGPDAAQPFFRRVFWVKEYDRSEDPEGADATTAPSEAVDPRTIRPGEAGTLTESAWGAPLS